MTIKLSTYLFLALLVSTNISFNSLVAMDQKSNQISSANRTFPTKRRISESDDTHQAKRPREGTNIANEDRPTNGLLARIKQRFKNIFGIFFATPLVNSSNQTTTPSNSQQEAITKPIQHFSLQCFILGNVEEGMNIEDTMKILFPSIKKSPDNTFKFYLPKSVTQASLQVAIRELLSIASSFIQDEANTEPEALEQQLAHRIERFDQKLKNDLLKFAILNKSDVLVHTSIHSQWTMIALDSQEASILKEKIDHYFPWIKELSTRWNPNTLFIKEYAINNESSGFFFDYRSILSREYIFNNAETICLAGKLLKHIFDFQLDLEIEYFPLLVLPLFFDKYEITDATTQKNIKRILKKYLRYIDSTSPLLKILDFTKDSIDKEQLDKNKVNFQFIESFTNSKPTALKLEIPAELSSSEYELLTTIFEKNICKYNNLTKLTIRKQLNARYFRGENALKEMDAVIIKKMLKKCKNLEELELSYISPKGFEIKHQKLTNILWVVCNCEAPYDDGPIFNCPSLQTFKIISGNGSTSKIPLISINSIITNSPQLKHLKLIGGVSDSTSLRIELPLLEELDISHCSKLSCLYLGCPKLKNLSLINCYNIEKAYGLDNSRQLEEINLDLPLFCEDTPPPAWQKCIKELVQELPNCRISAKHNSWYKTATESNKMQYGMQYGNVSP